jgi:hypothetical protein
VKEGELFAPIDVTVYDEFDNLLRPELTWTTDDYSQLEEDRIRAGHAPQYHWDTTVSVTAGDVTKELTLPFTQESLLASSTPHIQRQRGDIWGLVYGRIASFEIEILSLGPCDLPKAYEFQWFVQPHCSNRDEWELHIDNNFETLEVTPMGLSLYLKVYDQDWGSMSHKIVIENLEFILEYDLCAL